jgi:hypothetical protein
VAQKNEKTCAFWDPMQKLVYLNEIWDQRKIGASLTQRAGSREEENAETQISKVFNETYLQELLEANRQLIHREKSINDGFWSSKR